MLNFYLQNELKVLILDSFLLTGPFLMLQDELNVKLKKTILKDQLIFQLILKAVLKLSLIFPFFKRKTKDLKLKYPLYLLSLTTLQSAEKAFFDFLLKINIFLFFKYKNIVFILKKVKEKNFFSSSRFFIQEFIDSLIKNFLFFVTVDRKYFF